MAVQRRWRVLAGALAIQIAISTVASALAVLLPLVKAEFHLTFAQAGLLANIAFVGAFASVLAAGWAVDVLGDRVVLLLGGVLTGLSGIGCALAPSFAALVGFLVLMGVGITTPTPAGSLAVRAAFPLRLRGMVISIRQTGVPLGGFVAAVALPGIAVASGWRRALGLAGGATIIVTVAAMALYRKSFRPETVSGTRPRMRIDRYLSRDVLGAGGVGLLLVAGQSCLVTYLVVYLVDDWRLPITTAALFLGVAQLAGAGGRVLWGTLSDRVLHGNRGLAVVLAGGTAAVGSVALGALPGAMPVPFLLTLILFFAIGASGWTGVQIALLSELARPGQEGRTVAMGMMVQQPGIVFGPPLFGLVVDSTQSFRPAWIILGGVMGIAALTMTRVGRYTKA